ncbi:MAG: biotin/lipoate A/B protein ligase family protein [Micrococcaceae bacterium]
MQYHGEYKVPQGKLVIVDFDVQDSKFKNFSLSGDFFLEPDEALDAINAAINGSSIEDSRERLTRYINDHVPRHTYFTGFKPNDVVSAIRRALGKATTWDQHEFTVLPAKDMSAEMNVALDQVISDELAEGTRTPLLRFWTWNSAAVVIGSFQSFKNEVNEEAADKYDVSVVRRISGGGAMFMEPGNCVTYSLYVPQTLVDELTFEDAYAFLDQWVLEAFEAIGIKAFYKPLNDIATENGKIGGAAQKRFANGALLHHVTMSYDIDADKMMEVLRIGKTKISDKGIKSAKKRVDPLKSQTGMAREELIEHLKNFFIEKYHAKEDKLTQEELDKAQKLVDEKFSSDEWNRRVD